MSVNDQVAMNEQLTTLRKQGLGIDGDNRYKQDVLDCAAGALATGYQGGQEPPEGHWCWRFYEIGRAERESRARADAERDKYARVANDIGATYRQCVAQRDIEQALLAEAVELLSYCKTGEPLNEALPARVDAFLERHDQIREGQQLGQGELAGDEDARCEQAAMAAGLISLSYGIRSVSDQFSTFKAGFKAGSARREQVETMSFEYVDTSSERRTVTVTRDDVIERMEDALYERLGEQICHCEPVGETNVVDCNCQDYVEQFTLVKPHSSMGGSDHE